MTDRSRINRFFAAIGRFRSAARAAAAVENGRSPSPSDLERLGISVIAFGAINRS
jgi:hypothetical protein